MKKILLTVGIATVLGACTSAANTNSSQEEKSQPALNNTKWSLADNVKGRIPTLRIEGEKINGNTGCNNYFGALTTDASSGFFSAGKIGTTRMACPNPDVEQNFLSMLQKANKYVIHGDALELYQDGTLLLKFHKAE